MYQTLICLEISIFLVYAVAVYTVDTTKTSDTSDSIENSDPIDTNTYCDGSEWIPYKDEKCFKLIRKWATYKEAEEICKNEPLQAVSFLPALVSIKSADEQNYLANFIFNTSGVNINVWIGAERRPENNNQFVWNDGSSINFINWAEGSPSEEIRRGCVQMQSGFARQFSNASNLDNDAIYGKWKDVSCDAANYVICQKLQSWSFPQLQQTFLDLRKELKDSLDIVTEQLSNTQNELHNTKILLSVAENKIEDLQRNPVPIGFIYAQLPGQPEPMNLWPAVQWGDVSSEYAGLFFRVLGGGSATFGETQNENSPRLNGVLSFGHSWPGNSASYTHGPISIDANDNWSMGVYSGQNTGDMYSMRFKVSGGEVRSRNKAVRIWKRTK